MSDGESLKLTAYALQERTPQIIPAPVERDWMTDTEGRFAYRCLPLPMANQSGWMLLNDQPFRVCWDGGPSKSALTVSYEGENNDPWASSHFGYGVLSWRVSYLFRTPPGYNLLVRGPANAPKDAACPLEGIVETDWTAATFTMNWKITRPSVELRFDEGEPFCMIVPQRRGELESFSPEIRRIDPESMDGRRWRAWDISRFNHFFKPSLSARSSKTFQKDYLIGRDLYTGETFSDHQKRIRLNPFDDLRGEMAYGNGKL